MEIIEIKDRLRRYFQSQPEIIVGYFFGSRARGKENKLSDIDIAILIDEICLREKDYSYGYKVKAITDLIGILETDKIDFIILNESPLYLCFNVIRDGINLYSRDEQKRIEFEVKIMQRYFDQQYYYKRHAQATVNRIAKEGIL